MAVELNDQVRAGLVRAQRRLSRFDRVVRWVEGKNIHLTLKFLGEVPDQGIVPVCDAVQAAAAACAPFGFEVGGLGCFPAGGQVRVVWAGVHGELDGLRRAQRGVEQELERVGFDPERRAYSPHLTIGRVRDRQDTHELRAALDEAELEGEAVAVDEVILFESQLTPRGPIYTAVTRAPLHAESGP